MKYILILVSVTMMMSCINRNQSHSASETKTRGIECRSCEEGAFYNSLLPYFNWSGDWLFGEFYYHIFFFEKRGQSYFTIWLDMSYPSLNLARWDNYKNEYNDQYMKINNHDVFLITDINDSLPINFIGDCSKYFMDKESVPTYNSLVEWDDTCYPMTFQYGFVNGRYEVRSADLDINFFDKEMIGYENWLRENGYVKEPYF